MLVLDLDHTLLNSCRDADLQPEHRQRLHAQLEAQQGQASPPRGASVMVQDLKMQGLGLGSCQQLHAQLEAQQGQASPLVELASGFRIWTLGFGA